MRNIKDLKENEVIVISGKKDRKNFLKACKKEGLYIQGIKRYAPNSFEVVLSGNTILWNDEFTYKKYTKIPASEFIKPKKEYATKEFVLQEIAKHLEVKEEPVTQCSEYMNTPVVEEKKVIDWDKPQLLCDASGDLIVAATGKHNNDEFEAFIFRDSRKFYNEGTLYHDWAKSCFKPFSYENKN